ncbi:DUF3105 domain-containing protein [Streptomyces sp. SID8499]|uniref:DUF3105 domain-containing protein n=2 Tax=unclassified Streptomyces TaxID=2593676 RepID=UPI0013C96F4F|nr:DUF3105 domain-containing protein [Streptomyces sp. SID8499]NED33355.1 DUF3105 domain-containing protein [Streptomyces sp. SID8499]
MASAPQPGPTGTTGSDQRRAHMEELRRAEQARQRRNRVLGIVASVAVVAGLTVGGVLFVHAQTAQSENGGTAGSAVEAKSGQDGKNTKPGGAGHFTTGPDGVRTWQGTLTRNHTTDPVTYPMEPPVGGDHNPVWQNCNGDVYTAPIKNEHAVHALEHGAVWVTYNAKAAKADVAALAEKVRRTPYTLMSPVADQKDPIMLSAWAHQRSVSGAKDPNVDKFLAEFVQGAQTPEPGAACTGGVDR